MDIVSRVKGILLKPKDEWQKIKTETTTIPQLFTGYVVILTAVPAVASIIGLGLIGHRVPFVGWVRIGLGTALMRGIVFYLFSIITAYVGGYVINLLAPSFGSKQGMENAMKLTVYSLTPMWVAGALNIIPALGILVFLGSLYGVYILYLGLNAGLMETPQDKVVGYMVVICVVAFVIMFVLSIILGAIFAMGYGFRVF
jgi:Yip1-like protein